MYFTQRASIYVLLSIWCTSILISVPYLWLADYLTDPNQCHLNMDKFHLVYIYSMNTLFVFIPTISLTVLYLIIIAKIKKIGKNSYTNDSTSNITSKTDLNSIYNNEKKIIYRKSSACFFENKNNKRNAKLRSSNSSMNPPKIKIVFKKYPSEHGTPREKIYLIPNKMLNKSIEIDSKITAVDSKSNGRKLSFTIILTVTFFCCQLPIRIFICWANWKNTFSPVLIDENKTENIESYYHVDLISRSTTLMYYLHCVSNPIIYNIFSFKFRKAFLFVVKNLFSFKKISQY